MSQVGDVKTKVFVREATGLVRSVRSGDSFFATFALVTGGVPIFLISLLFLSPNANYTLALLIMFVPSIALAAAYTLFGISMPRSGGDYVFVSRGLNSFLGFVNSFGLFFAYVFSVGVYAMFGMQYIGYTFTTYGFLQHADNLTSIGSWILSTNASVILGVVTILFFLLLLTFGSTRLTFRLIFWTGVLEVIAVVLFFAINATISQSSFVQHFNDMAGSPDAYQKVISDATANGLGAKSSMAGTVLALPIAWYAFTWYTLPANWAGELRNVRRSLPISIVGALAFILIFYIVFYGVTFHAFGQTFVTAWSYNYNQGTSMPFDYIGTYTPFFVSLVYANPIIPILALLVFWLPDIMFFAPTLIAGTRYLFSWSFDRTAPEIFSKVSERTKVPVVATVTVGVVAVVGLLAYAYIPSIAIVDVIPIFDFGFIIPAMTAIVLPFWKKNLYESSFVVKRKVIGLPVLSWLGIIALVGIIYGIIGLWNSYLMPINFETGVAISAVYVLGAAIYISMFVANRRKGIDIRHAFAEIPPE
jgi:amino acid transporter